MSLHQEGRNEETNVSKKLPQLPKDNHRVSVDRPRRHRAPVKPKPGVERLVDGRMGGADLMWPHHFKQAETYALPRPGVKSTRHPHSTDLQQILYKPPVELRPSCCLLFPFWPVLCSSSISIWPSTCKGFDSNATPMHALAPTSAEIRLRRSWQIYPPRDIHPAHDKIEHQIAPVNREAFPGSLIRLFRLEK